MLGTCRTRVSRQARRAATSVLQGSWAGRYAGLSTPFRRLEVPITLSS